MMTEIEKVKAEIKMLEKKLALLEEMDKYRSPAEEAYKECYGKYPEPGFSANDWDAITWTAFLNGYQATQPKAVPVDEPSYYDEIEHDISENVENKTIRQVIDRWWMDTFTSKNMWSVNECIDDLADQIEFWILRSKK